GASPALRSSDCRCAFWYWRAYVWHTKCGLDWAARQEPNERAQWTREPAWSCVERSAPSKCWGSKQTRRLGSNHKLPKDAPEDGSKCDRQSGSYDETKDRRMIDHDDPLLLLVVLQIQCQPQLSKNEDVNILDLRKGEPR